MKPIPAALSLFCLVAAAAVVAVVPAVSAGAAGDGVARPRGSEPTTRFEVALDVPAVLEGDMVRGAVSGSFPGPELLVQWIDPFGGIWYSSSFSARANATVNFSFWASPVAAPVMSVRASSLSQMATAAIAIFPRADTTWDSFVVVADKVPKGDPSAAAGLRNLGVDAAFTTGLAEALSAWRLGLRPFASGLSSASLFSIHPQSFATAAAEYERAPGAKLLVRDPSLADRTAVSIATGEASRQVPLLRSLAPQCYVIADSPSVTRASSPFDYSFADADLRGFASFLAQRFGDPGAASVHWPRPGADFSSLPPATARDTKTAVLRSTDALTDIAPWALHREYTDNAFADALRALSSAVSFAAVSPGDDSFNWSLVTPVTCIAGLEAPSCYGGFAWSRLVSSANVLAVSPDAAGWTWQLAGDLGIDNRVLAAVKTSSREPAAAVWRALSRGVDGIHVVDFQRLYDEAAAQSRSRAPGSSPSTASDTASAFGEIAAGLGDLVSRSANDAPVALVYSAASVRAGWMLEYLASDTFAPASPQAGARALAAWSDLLSDLGVQFRWISMEDVSAGLLARTRYNAVILPEVWCLSQTGLAALKLYVDSGGTLIADNGAGLLDADYAAARVSPADELFAVRRAPLTAAKIRRLASARGQSGLVADPDLVTGAKTSGPVGAAKTSIVSASGRGGVVYLNMLVSSYPSGGPDIRTQLRNAVASALTKALVTPAASVLQGGRPVEAKVFSRTLGDSRILFIEPQGAIDPAVQLEVRLPFAADCYNLRPSFLQGEPLLNNAAFFVQPPAVGPVILSMNPFPVTALPVELQYSGQGISVRATLEARREIAGRLMRVEVYAPYGERMAQFDRTLVAEKGILNTRIELPLNAMRGTWRVLVRDLATYMASWADVDVR